MNWKTPEKRKSIPRLLSVIVVTMSEKVKSFKRPLLHKRSKSKGIYMEGYPEKYHFLLFYAFTINPTGGHFVCAGVNMGCWSATEAFSLNCLRSVPVFASCLLELNGVYWVLRSTNVFFNVSWYLYGESEFIVASLSPLRGHIVG